VVAGDSRRRLTLFAFVALIVFSGVATAYAWNEYGDARKQAINERRTRAVLAATVFDTYFTGEIGTLSSLAQSTPVVEGDEPAMLSYFGRVQRSSGKLFPGGLGWVNAQGIARVSTSHAKPGTILDVSDRSYFKVPKRTGKPFVSEGIVGRLTGTHVIVMAVPTKAADGKFSGVVLGTLLVKPAKPNAASISLGYTGMSILDRSGQSILSGFARARNLAVTKRFGGVGSGVLADARGLNGDAGHVLAYARAGVPRWTVVLDESRSSVFAAARRGLLLQLALIGGVALIALAVLAWLVGKMRSEATAARTRARGRLLRYEQEHEVAITLQRSLLPELPAIESVDSAGRYEAGSTGLEVGGDWYDVLRRPDGLIHVTVGDVAGRGVSAAALMGQLRHAFRAYAYEIDSPAQLVRRLTRHVGEDEMATAVCFTIDPYTSELSYASAGHLPALLRDDATGLTARLDETQAPPLGFAARSLVHEVAVSLPERATLVLYTDGVVERRDRPLDDGIGEIEQVLATSPPSTTASELADRLVRDVAAPTGADDDSALLVLRFLGVPTTFEAEVASDPSGFSELRRRVSRWLAARGVGEEERADLVLAISEACNNSSEHGYADAPGTIRLKLDHSAERIRMLVEDAGTWRPPEADPDRGRGMLLMKSLTDSVAIEHTGDRTRVTLERKLART
jgi:serine phosphatase RsbU (regulator of sigma subunit)/anti-sigma regulatory factor (Ser/Thr protein kinase)